VSGEELFVAKASDAAGCGLMSNHTHLESCSETLHVVAAAMLRIETRHFQIALVGYRLDGRPIRLTASR
jgi:hypothetical protein